jgi:N-acetylglucosamine-6-phosphate deacetylase
MDFIVSNNRFFEIMEKIPENKYNFDEIIDLDSQLVLPGLFDIHTHGIIGEDFNSSSKEGIIKALDFYLSQGVTSLYPTVMTDHPDTMIKQLRLISEVAKDYKIIKGIHLEGPFLNPIYKGAMPKDYLFTPTIELFNTFNKAANQLIKIVTIAPELDGAIELIKYLNDKGIIASIGHTAASYNEAMAGINAGAKSFTHTFNAMKLSHQHDPNAMGAALLSSSYAEVIADGLHVHPDMVRLLVNHKGVDKVIGITDSMMAAGLGDGMFTLGINQVIVKNKDAKIKDTDTRAGSTLLASECLDNLIKFTGLSIEYAIDMMTINPATMLGLDHEYGQIKQGYIADFFIKNK